MEISVRGEILSYDASTGVGLISGDDGARYDFTSAALQSPAVPAAGVRVDFVPEGAAATQILILAGSPTTTGVAGGYASSTSTAVAGFDWQKLFLSFEGRIRRSHFWIGWLILLGVNVVISWIPFINLLGIVLIWPNLAISVMEQTHAEVIAGLNLPMLIKLASVRGRETLESCVAHAQDAGRTYISVASWVLAGEK